MKQRRLSFLVLLLCSIFVFVSGQGMARESHPPAEPQVIPLGQENSLWEMDRLSPGEPGGEVKFSAQEFPKTFNNLLGDRKATKDVTRIIMGSGLVAENPLNGRIVPGMAKSWEVSKDGLTYTFHLRRGLRFSDGKPLTAEDVVFTYRKLIFNKKVETEKREVLRINGQLPEISRLDELTISFTLPEPHGPFPRRVSTGIYPQHLFRDFNLEEFHETWDLETGASNPEKIVGAGPFQLEKFVPNEKIVLSRNPYYYKVDPEGTQLPYLNRYRVFKVEDTDVEFLKFKNDETDLLRAQVQDMPYLLSNDEDEGWRVTTGADSRGVPLNSDFLVFNWNTDEEKLGELFRSSKFRRAVSYLIDRQKLINEVFNSFGKLQYGPISRLSPYHNRSLRELVPREHDPDQAKDLLKELDLNDRNGDGWLESRSGEKVSFTILVNEDNKVRTGSARIISDSLNKVGIEAEVKQTSFENLSSRLIRGNYQAAIIRILSNPVEPSTLSDLFTTSGPVHLWHPEARTNPTDWEKKIDELFRKGLRASGFEARKSYYDRFQEIYAEHLPIIYLPGESFLFATNSSLRNTAEFSRLGTFIDFAEFVWLKE